MSGLAYSKCTRTPMRSGTPLSKFDCQLLHNVYEFRSLVKALQYFFFTGPDIAFHVNKLCMFLQALIDAHWDALKCVLHYLKLILIMDCSCPSLPPIS